MTRDEFWARRFEMLVGTRDERAERADQDLALFDKRFPLTSLDVAINKAIDQEIGKLRALVLRGTALAVRLQQVVCAHLCDDSAGRTRHHTDCVDVRQWLADCRAEGLE